MLLTYSVLLRMNLRNNNIPPLTKIDQIYDNEFSDEFLFKQIPVMKEKNVDN